MTGLEELAWLSQLMLASAAAELAAANISQLTVLEHSMAILLDFDRVPPSFLGKNECPKYNVVLINIQK